MSKVFCVNCDIYVDYLVQGRDTEITVRDKCFKCRELYATCVKCVNEVYVPRVNDINVYLREKAFNEQGEQL